MSYYSYSSNSKYSRRAIKRMIGFQIFCYRTKIKLRLKNFVKNVALLHQSWKSLNWGWLSEPLQTGR